MVNHIHEVFDRVALVDSIIATAQEAFYSLLGTLTTRACLERKGCKGSGRDLSLERRSTRLGDLVCACCDEIEERVGVLFALVEGGVSWQANLNGGHRCDPDAGRGRYLHALPRRKRGRGSAQ